MKKFGIILLALLCLTSAFVGCDSSEDKTAGDTADKPGTTASADASTTASTTKQTEKPSANSDQSSNGGSNGAESTGDQETSTKPAVMLDPDSRDKAEKALIILKEASELCSTALNGFDAVQTFNDKNSTPESVMADFATAAGYDAAVFEANAGCNSQEFLYGYKKEAKEYRLQAVKSYIYAQVLLGNAQTKLSEAGDLMNALPAGEVRDCVYNLLNRVLAYYHNYTTQIMNGLAEYDAEMRDNFEHYINSEASALERALG